MKSDSAPTLFSEEAPRPLADRLRPRTLEEIAGQEHLLGVGGPLRRMMTDERLTSLILWGPPGCGKTTLARLLAERSGLHFEPLSAVFSGVAELRKVFDQAASRWTTGQGTCLFVDEIHRFNRTQQDGFLPVVEDGTIILIGATTENPGFALNAALLSRCPVFVLKRLNNVALDLLLQRAEALAGHSLPVQKDGREALKQMADGDGRHLLNMAETLLSLKVDKPLTVKDLGQAVQRRVPIYDKAQDSHYNLISALHKSLRGSDCDAALYWFSRMLAGGEDPLYIARRLLRFAYEDVGLADPQAAAQTLSAWNTYERLGSPEGELALAQAVIYLATAPKSNAVYAAFKTGSRLAKRTGSLMPPKHILNAPVKLMKDLGYGRDYDYDHEAPDGFSGQTYFPDGMKREQMYHPADRGFEREIAKRQAWWQKLREKRGKHREQSTHYPP